MERLPLYRYVQFWTTPTATPPSPAVDHHRDIFLFPVVVDELYHPDDGVGGVWLAVVRPGVVVVLTDDLLLLWAGGRREGGRRRRREGRGGREGGRGRRREVEEREGGGGKERRGRERKGRGK